jgi:hypothetical protein
MKASYTGSFSKNSSESGSNASQWFHLLYGERLISGSVRTAGYVCEKRGRPIFDVKKKKKQDS